MPGAPATTTVLAALAELQRDALGTLARKTLLLDQLAIDEGVRDIGDGDTAPREGGRLDREFNACVRAAVALARSHGFDVAGCGSTRVAVELGSDWPEPAVAKVAYDHRGLAMNLAEAAFFLALPRRVRDHLAPCLVLTSEVVLIQQRVDVLGTTLVEALDRGLSTEQQGGLDKAVLVEAVPHVNKLRAACGFPVPAWEARLDNFGEHDGRVVAIDYGEKWRPIEPAWAWILARLEDGPLSLDQAARDAFYGELEQGEIALERTSCLWLAARAGVRFAATDPCPCGADDAYGSCPGKCRLNVDEAEYLDSGAHINYAAPSPFLAAMRRAGWGFRRQPTSTEEAIGEGLCELAGIPSRVAGRTWEPVAPGD